MSHYTEIIRKWATDNRRVGRLPNADGTGEVGLKSTEVGKRLAVRFTLKVEFDRIADARYQVFGCGFSMAACAIAANLAVGYTLNDVQ
ncbi:MAG: iron-sulfur cluster assembly scaffold protein, partial [Desulfuromonadales bacterium]|nr:iron-sulfur cluster assembly scaffold protein [Desulfuromonadales bacterium]